MELTPLRQPSGVGHQAGDGLEPPFLPVQAWQGVEQPFGVRVGRLIENVFQTAELYDFSRVHDGHLVAGFRHHAQIMGDENHGSAKFVLQRFHHIQHLGLDGHI